MKTNSGVTIFNQYADPASRATKYKRTWVDGVEWQNTMAANIRATGGHTAADQAAIFIPIARANDYLPPKEWQAQTDKSATWTLQVGDTVVRGKVQQELSDEYTVSQLKRDYDDVLTITSVDRQDSGSLSMKHFEVGAK